MERGENGNRVVSVKTAAGISLATLVAGFTLFTSVAKWLGLPTPAEYHESQKLISEKLDECATRQELNALTAAVNDMGRRMVMFGMTDEEIGKRMRGGAGG